MSYHLVGFIWAPKNNKCHLLWLQQQHVGWFLTSQWMLLKVHVVVNPYTISIRCLLFKGVESMVHLQMLLITHMGSCLPILARCNFMETISNGFRTCVLLWTTTIYLWQTEIQVHKGRSWQKLVFGILQMINFKYYNQYRISSTLMLG